MFPEEEHLGVDVVLPDFTHLAESGDELLGVVLTHGHEDHIGALPYFLDRFDVPIYGTPLTLALVKEKLREFDLERQARLVAVRDGETIAPRRLRGRDRSRSRTASPAASASRSTRRPA